MDDNNSATDSGPDEQVDTSDIKRPDLPGYGKDDQDYVDRSVIDFDPEDGLYAGTAVDGTSEIPEVSKQEIEEEKQRQGLADPDGDVSSADVPDDHPKPFPHDGKGPDAEQDDTD